MVARGCPRLLTRTAPCVWRSRSDDTGVHLGGGAHCGHRSQSRTDARSRCDRRFPKRTLDLPGSATTGRPAGCRGVPADARRCPVRKIGAHRRRMPLPRLRLPRGSRGERGCDVRWVSTRGETLVRRSGTCEMDGPDGPGQIRDRRQPQRSRRLAECAPDNARSGLGCGIGEGLRWDSANSRQRSVSTGNPRVDRVGSPSPPVAGRSRSQRGEVPRIAARNQ